MALRQGLGASASGESLTGGANSHRGPAGDRGHGWLPLWEAAETVRRRSTRPGSLLWTRNVNHRIGAFVALLLRPTAVSPNLVSLIGFVLHLGGAVYVTTLAPSVSLPSMLLVLALWQLAFGCDCADGQLARERGQSSPFGAWLDQVADFGSHVAVFGSFAAFLARSVSVSLASTALLTAFVLGANLLGLFASSQRNSLMASVPAVDHGQSRLLALAMQARHLTDYGAFLLIASLLLLVPSLLAFFLLATGVLTTLLVISQATLHWSR